MIYDWPGEGEPPHALLEQLPVEAVVSHKGGLIGWWDGKELRPIKVLGISVGEDIIPDPEHQG